MAMAAARAAALLLAAAALAAAQSPTHTETTQHACLPQPVAPGCVPTGKKESGAQCFDGIDNDCDGMSDCCDPDCQFNPQTGPRCAAEGYGAIGTTQSPFNGNRICNPAKLQAQVTSIEDNCCPDGDCSSTPDSCPARCAAVFVPFYEACENFVSPAALKADLGKLFPICQRSLQAASTNPDQAHPDTCTFEEFLPVALACSDYVGGQGGGAGNDLETFCSTHCFESAFVFVRRCAADMTAVMRLGLGQVMPDLDRCAAEGRQPPASIPAIGGRGNGGGGVDLGVQCDQRAALGAVQSRCSDPSALISSAPPGGAPRPPPPPPPCPTIFWAIPPYL
eukprot:SAG22_NODE_319_length_12493_cov_33.326475_6_plen_336_part_00